MTVEMEEEEFRGLGDGKVGDGIEADSEHRQGIVQTQDEEGISEHGFRIDNDCSVFPGLKPP